MMKCIDSQYRTCFMGGSIAVVEKMRSVDGGQVVEMRTA